MTKARLGLVIPKTNEKRSRSIVGKELDPPKGQLRSNSNSGKKSGPFYQVYQIEDDRGPTIVALHKTVPSHFEFLPSKVNLMRRFGTYQIKKRPAR